MPVPHRLGADIARRQPSESQPYWGPQSVHSTSRNQRLTRSEPADQVG